MKGGQQSLLIGYTHARLSAQASKWLLIGSFSVLCEPQDGTTPYCKSWGAVMAGNIRSLDRRGCSKILLCVADAPGG
jgi:hypothetical protein